MPIHLIIKGDRYEAAKAASTRSIPLVFNSETAHNETLAQTSEQFFDKVQDWFLEDAYAHPPYALGSLLHYSQR